ncbi:hypothetical protein SAMN05421788_108305 [Filimonas lacunae]|uniref:Uncharacterized protein n=2 Tax=Filimonas lacunae TaxID=477680 RepID=A0A173MDH7_9BACT|nr:hypothetical protein FLA_1563 [Filimonas lacunae]SIT29386.1 hypothetical protein SAMN05421788_108305 [Filimonas lacunae]
MQGKEVMNPHFQPLAEWIKETYGVQPINILYENIEDGLVQQLAIWFEHKKTEAHFLNKDGYSFDKNKIKAITQKFQQLLREQGLEKKKDQPDTWESIREYLTEEVLITYNYFDKLAITEANEAITTAQVKQLEQQLSAEGLWQISRLYGSTTFFAHTQQQVKDFTDNGTWKRWGDTWFALLQQQDEFGYIKRDKLYLVLDSKENFMDNYEGKWYYYYK